VNISNQYQIFFSLFESSHVVLFFSCHADKCKSLKVFSKIDNLDAFVAALPPAFTRRFGEIIWAYGGIGFGWWPACIYDPRLTVGGARKLALKNIGKKHLVYFFGCSDTPFTVLPDNKCLAWEEGLLEEHDLGKSAKAMGRARTMMFEWALQAATAENDKPIEYRLDWNHQGEDSCAVSSVVHYGQSSGGGSGGQSGGKGRNTNGKLQGRVLESKKEQGRDSGDTGSHSSSKRDSSGSSIGKRLDSDQITRKQSGHGQDKSVKRIKTAALEPDNDVPSKDASATVNAPSSIVIHRIASNVEMSNKTVCPCHHDLLTINRIITIHYTKVTMYSGELSFSRE
jgi:hypothetical protein